MTSVFKCLSIIHEARIQCNIDVVNLCVHMRICKVMSPWLKGPLLWVFVKHIDTIDTLALIVTIRGCPVR